MNKYLKLYPLLATLVLFPILLLVFTANQSKAWVYQTHSTKCNYGISKIHYWPSGSLTEWQKKTINDTLYRWNSGNGTGVHTPTHVTYTSVRENSVMDYFYSPTGYHCGYAAETVHLKSRNVPIDWTKYNWNSSKITALGKTYNNLSNAQKTMAWAHESGHAFGLDHNNDSKHPSVMETYPYIIKYFNGPTKNDLAGINYLY